MVSPKVFSGNDFGLKWNANVEDGMGYFPQYFKDSADFRVAIPESELPPQTRLKIREFQKPNENPSPYYAELKGAWRYPGPAAGPFYAYLNDNSVVVYFWYRFIDQPVFQQFNCSESKKDKLVLGAEMFESDGQIMFDEYMNDLISEKSFESEMRLWPNYETDYKPIVLFAKENNLKFIATNIPRRYASLVYKKDFAGLEKLSDDAKKFIAPLPIKWDAEVGCYKQMIDGMKGMGGPGGETIAKAQAMKDATMAHFILKNWTKGQLFYHFNGSFHSDNHEGICWHILQENSKVKILTISTALQTDISSLEDDYKNTADFIICIPEDMTTTY